MSGTTPASLTVTWDPSVTSYIPYQTRSTPGLIVINGPGNAITIPATFNVTGIQTFQTFLGASGLGPDGLVFSAQTGSSPAPQTINIDPPGAITTTVDQTWMTAAAPTSATVTATVNPAGLAAGVYHGTVTIGEPGLASIGVPVVLGVWSTAPPPTISPGAFTFIQTMGEPVPLYQNAIVDPGSIPVPLTYSTGPSPSPKTRKGRRVVSPGGGLCWYSHRSWHGGAHQGGDSPNGKGWLESTRGGSRGCQTVA
jgi:hypothetical protein